MSFAEITLPGLCAAALLVLSAGCSAAGGARAESASQPTAEAGFVELEPRNVELEGRPVSLAARSRLFYNFSPADSAAADAPVVVVFNGFAADVVRGFGTGPSTVLADGSVVENPDSLTR